MRVFLLTTLLGAGLLCSCTRPTSPADTDQQQGNPKAQPEKSATGNDNKQPGDDKSGKSAHTGLPEQQKSQ